VGGGLLVRTLYQRGEFEGGDTAAVWLTLAAYSIGLVAVGASRLTQNALFARGDTRGPAWIALVRVVVAAGLGFLLMFQLDAVEVRPTDDTANVVDLVDEGVDVDEGLPAPLEPSGEALSGLARRLDAREGEERQERPEAGTVGAAGAGGGAVPLGTVGLALGSGVAAWVELLLLRRLLRRTVGGSTGTAAAVRALLPALGAGTVAALAASAFARPFPPLVEAAVVLGLAGLWYLGVAIATGVPEARALGERVLQRPRSRRG